MSSITNTVGLDEENSNNPFSFWQRYGKLPMSTYICYQALLNNFSTIIFILVTTKVAQDARAYSDGAQLIVILVPKVSHLLIGGLMLWRG